MRTSWMLAAALTFAIAAGCTGGGDDDDDDDDDGGAGGTLAVSGYAVGTHATEDITAECVMDLYLFDLVETDTGWEGSIGGELIRSVAVGDSGGEAQFLMGGPDPGVVVESNGSVALSLVGDVDTIPFWLALETITGTIDGELEYSGSFDCAPLDLQLGPGVNDTALTIQGTWDAALLPPPG